MQDSRREKGGERTWRYTTADERGEHRLEISFSHTGFTARRSQVTSASEETMGWAALSCPEEEL